MKQETSHLASHELHIANNEKPNEPTQFHHPLKSDPLRQNPSTSESFCHGSDQVPVDRSECCEYQFLYYIKFGTFINRPR